MKWIKEEITKAIALISDGKSYNEIAIELNRSRKSVKEKLNDVGYIFTDFSDSRYYITKKCKECQNDFKSLKSDNRIFCNQTCSTIFNNKLRGKSEVCLNCGEIKSGDNKNYCNHKCQHEHRDKLRIEEIETGESKLSSRNFKIYLIQKHGDKCMRCGWCEINPVTGKVPIELEHIDGNSDNNSLNNLKLLCPNCHSLTSTYKGLNVGKGRHSRRKRYKDGKSY